MKYIATGTKQNIIGKVSSTKSNMTFTSVALHQ